MCLNAIGRHAVDTVIGDSGGALPYSSMSAASNHLIHLIISSPFYHRPSPPLPGSLVPACFKQSPAPGRGRRRREGGLRLRADRRFACFPSCRAALSLPLVRYCPSPRHRLLPSSSLFNVIAAVSIRPPASPSPMPPITPAGHALPAYRHALLVERRGGATG